MSLDTLMFNETLLVLIKPCTFVIIQNMLGLINTVNLFFTV